MSVAEVAFDGGILDGSVYAFDLPVGPGMVELGQPMLNRMKETEPVAGVATEARGWRQPVLRQIGERAWMIWNCLDKCFKEHGGCSHIGPFHQLQDGELRGEVAGYEQ